MNIKDPRALEEVFNEFFPTRRNPAGADDEGNDWRSKMNAMLYGVAARETAMDTWDETQWTEHLERVGFEADEVQMALEMVASWGITDDA